MIKKLLTISLCFFVLTNCSLNNDSRGVYFESSFETDTGKSDEARLDGGKWDYHGDGGGDIDYIEVISEFEMPGGEMALPVDGNNMLSIGANGPLTEYIRVNDFIRLEDEHTYLRFYMLVLKPEGADGSFGGMLHGIQDLDSSTNVWIYHTSFQADGWYAASGFIKTPHDANVDYFGNGHTMVGDILPYETVSNLTLYMTSDPEANKNGMLDYYRWYRFEIHVHWLVRKTTSTPTIFEIRVYDDTNTLVKDNNNFFSENYDGGYHSQRKSITELYSFDNEAEGRRLYINGLARSIMFGVNGNSMTDVPRLYFIDKVAFSNEGWIGP